MTRAEKVAMAQALRAQGLKLREIAERMGAKMSTVHTWLADPDLTKQRARRRSYMGTCSECGLPTDGSNGRDKAPDICRSCYVKAHYEDRYWTRDQIVAWIKDYFVKHGHVPPATVQTRRAEFPDAPGTETTRREFGPDAWRKAVREAGFEPYRDHPGTGHKLGLDHVLMRETADLYRQGWSCSEIAGRHGVTATAIHARLDRLGVSRRSASEAAILRSRKAAA